jgi:hypothetical protein
MPPRAPKTAKSAASALVLAPAGAATDEIQDWDAYVEEATPDVQQFRKRLPDGTVLSVPCPSSTAVDDLGVAQADGDVPGMYVALFGADLAPQLLELTAEKAFTVRIKLINDVMMHYGMSLQNLPKSGTSST